MAELKTRIILRNDSTVNWNGESVEILKKGEVGLEFLENGKVKMKVGDGKNNWATLRYIGGDEAQTFQGEAQSSETDDEAIARLVSQTELHPGDVAIIKRIIAGDKVSHTAYVYDGAWKAMDGNYSANNIYFDKDLQTTAAIGNIALSNGQATIPAAGKNLNEVWEKIFVKEKEPTVINPSASWNSFDEKYLEIGTEDQTSVSLNFDDGNYEYGYQEGKQIISNGSTGVTPTVYNMSYNGATTNGKNQTIKSGIQTKIASKSISATVPYSEGKIPVSNIGNPMAEKRIASGSATVKGKTIFCWYIPMYAGFKYDTAIVADPANINNAEVKALTPITGKSAYNKIVPITATAKKSWMQYFVAVPAQFNKNISGAKDGNNLTLGITKANDVTINYHGTDIIYNVWYINNAAAYDTLKIELNW